jgi:hypothetical protein
MRAGAKKGRPSPFKGHHHSDKSRKKMRRAAYRRWMNAEFRALMAEARRRGRKSGPKGPRRRSE